MVWRCQRWNAAPFAGPVEEWPLAEVVRMEAAANVYAAFRARRLAQEAGAHADQWAAKNRLTVEFCAAIEALRARE